jgi:hypothetical protein
MPRLPRWSLIAGVLLIGFCLGGCKQSKLTGGKRTNVSHISFEGDPIVQSQSDPMADFARYQTFTWQSNPDREDPLIEKHLAVLELGLLEGLGYTPCAAAEGADLTISLAYKNEYQETYVPAVPSSGIVHKEDGSIDHMNSNKGGRAAYTRTNFQPEVRLFVMDSDRATSGPVEDAYVWTGKGVASSETSDIRLTGQTLLLYLLKSFPVCAEAERPERNVGLTWAVLSLDAQAFRPVVLIVDRDSRADRAGLRQWDVIETIGGVSTAGLALPAVRDLLTKGEGDAVTFTVARRGDMTDLTLTRPGSQQTTTINATW